MGYLHIDNLYKNQSVLQFPEVYALEKIHGTSAHLSYTPEGQSDAEDNGNGTKLGLEQAKLHIHSGELQSDFEALFDKAYLLNVFGAMNSKFKVHGECYGGKVQRQAWRYGDQLRFVVFDVSRNGVWLPVPEAEAVALALNLEFVHYVKIESALSQIDYWRDHVSTQALRNRVVAPEGVFLRREGVVLKPLQESVDHHGCRIIAKHKRDEERETKTVRTVNVSKVAALKVAQEIADEYVTMTRLEHVLQKLPPVTDMTSTKAVISAMIEDVEREASGEIIPSTAGRAAIGKASALLLKRYLSDKLKETQS